MALFSDRRPASPCSPAILNLGAQGFGVIIFAQAVWFTILGALLFRNRAPAR